MTLMEEEYEQLSVKLRVALEKLEEATKAADESERWLFYFPICVVLQW